MPDFVPTKAPNAQALELMKAQAPKAPVFSDKVEERVYIKFRLAQAFRIFGKLGYDEGLAGHITARDPIKPNCFWVNPMGLHFKHIQPSDLLLVDEEARVLDESGPYRLLNTAAFMIHSEIHKTRPDVLCIAHSHSLYGKAFATLGIKLDPLTQDSCAFFENHALYADFQGVALGAEEGKAIAEALGPYKAAILQNHGLVTATASIEATLFAYISLERCCQVQLMADAAAAARGKETVKIDPEQARKTG